MDLMIDIETLGLSPGCAIKQIGSCLFDKDTGNINEPKIIHININSNFNYGLRTDRSTMEWWSRQNEQAKRLFKEKGVALSLALKTFSKSYDFENIDTFWSHGSTFDFPILHEAYRVCGLQVPWLFKKIRDTRTIFDLFPVDFEKYKNDIPHSAGQDAEYQAKLVIDSYKLFKDSVIL